MLHLKAPSVFLLLFERLFPTQAVRGAVGGQETKWAGKSGMTTYYSHLHHHLLLLSQTSQEPKFYISPCCTRCKPNIKDEWNVNFKFLICCPLSVCLDSTVDAPKIKNTNLSKDSIQFCISHFSRHKYWASNPFSVKVNYKFESLPVTMINYNTLIFWWIAHTTKCYFLITTIVKPD